MKQSTKTKIILAILCSSPVFFLLILVFYCQFKRRQPSNNSKGASLEAGDDASSTNQAGEQLLNFAGGENLSANEILEAPGEVIGKSSYGTLYRAFIQGKSSAVAMRFVRPVCAAKSDAAMPAMRILGAVRHPNLVPLMSVYFGALGERLLVYPFFVAGNLAQFLKVGVAESQKWDIIYKLSYGIAKGLDHLHTGFEKPICHGNLKSNNVLLDTNYQTRLTDFGLHLILNPAAAQEMLEVSASQGYKAPELIKIKDIRKETDVYSLGVLMLEMLTQKDPINKCLHAKDSHLPNSSKSLILEHKVSDVFNSENISKSRSRKFNNEESLLLLFQIAMACCSPLPSSRPDIKHVVRMLEEIGPS